MGKIKLYSNESVKRVIAFIPPGHQHVRVIIELKDGVIILHEASIAGILRAYIDVVTHPSRRAVELVSTKLPKSVRKQGYAEAQLIESDRSEDEVLRDAIELWSNAELITG
ncbi:MAG: hypothetical protein DRO18_02960 [Thermoprotei archaeon]|nr:MAG: hypothetical protein DRO18_02960 [Thermoprotei archaeon]